jgi:hypothetical protein
VKFKNSKHEYREKFSVVLFVLGLFLLIATFRKQIIYRQPQKLLSEVLDNGNYFSVDQVARFIVSEDSSVQIIDLRSPEEFRTKYSRLNKYSVLNFLNSDPGNAYLKWKTRNILYSNGDFDQIMLLLLRED